MKYCKECLMPDTRPGIKFDKEGVCMACNYAKVKDKNIDWKKRKTEFKKLLKRYKRKDGKHDCIVPWSSGKDSSMIAYKLKYEYGMNPLLVRVDRQFETEEGRINTENFLNLGFDQILITPAIDVQKKLSRKFFIERGDNWFAWTRAIHTAPYRIAVALKIPLIVYAEHGETEYGGKILNKKDQKERSLNWSDKVFDTNPKQWGIPKSQLQFYQYPSKKEMENTGVKAIYFAYYHPWNALNQYLYAKKHFNFQTVKEGWTTFKRPGTTIQGRTEGTFTNYDSIDDGMDTIYYYMQYIKFGFGRCIRDASRLVQGGLMTRKEALRLCKKYDGEPPRRFFKQFLKYNNLTEEKFWKIVDKFRNKEIWYKVNGEWQMKNPLK